MRRWVGPLLMLLGCAVVGHWVALQQAPGLIMARAMESLAARGIALHRFTPPQRVTPYSQNVVRSSPDLYYALCRYDLSHPGMRLELRMGAWPKYQSLSFFDAQTNNFATLRATGATVRTALLPPGSAPEPGALVSPSTKGVILIRRLAPSANDFSAAAKAGKADLCRLVPRQRVRLPAGA